MLALALAGFWALGIAASVCGARLATWGIVDVPRYYARVLDAAYRAGAARAVRAGARSAASTPARDDLAAPSSVRSTEHTPGAPA